MDIPHPTPLPKGGGASSSSLSRAGRGDTRGIVAGLERRQLADKAAGWIVGAGGLATIASILAILVFIALEVFPLWLAPSVRLLSTVTPAAADALMGSTTDEYRQIVYGVTTSGSVRFLDLHDGRVLQEIAIDAMSGRQVSQVVRGGDQFMVSTADGEIIALQIRFDSTREGSQRVRTPGVTILGRWNILEGAPLSKLATSRFGEAGVTLVAAPASGAAVVFAISQTTNLFGDVQRSETRRDLPLRSPSRVTALAVTTNGRRAFVGTADGWVHYWDLSNKQEPLLVDAVQGAERGTAITALQVLIGDTSLVVGDGSGNVSVWFPVRDAVQDSGWRLQRVHELEPHRAVVTAVAASPRDKGFLTAAADGSVALRHSTSAQTLLWLDRDAGGVDVAFAPKANGALVASTSGELRNWEIQNPHPEISLKALFGRIWYEGYEAPSLVWQSTGGTDDFEPKLSLVPLIIGTLKGTFYALLFAVPIAVLAAIYTSQFMHPNVRTVVKPAIEIMAALPSVVLGFLAGLWLAPTMEGIVPAVLAMLVLLPALTFGFGVAWQGLPVSQRARLRPGFELLVLAVILIVGVQTCLTLNEPLENLLFGGNFRNWLQQEAGLRFDQRNCLVVGFAMGFAIIPIIFTISEDALSNVPQRLISGSLALGATRWQTAMRVVFPTASPGIFSAIMIGFGRAVGETMIVLMATGNTPVLDFNIFSGMRTLSANIAVEIPEAAHGSTLYRVLFLAALLLFTATFLVNTVAELVRQRLRRRYQQL